MSYIEYLQKTIDYIEDNIREPITIEKCAKRAGFSKYHFHRLFTLFVGVSLMEWVNENGYCEPWAKERYCLEEEFEEDGSTYMDIYTPIN